MEKVGIKVEMINEETHLIPLDEIIFIKVTGKYCSFFLKNSTPEAKRSLTKLWEMIQKAGKGYDHNLIKLGRKYIINLDYYEGEDPSRNMVILKKGPYTKVNTEIARKPKTKKEVPDYVRKIQERVAEQKKEIDEEQDSKIEKVQYYKEEIGEGPLKELRKILKERDKYEVLENYASKKVLKGSINDINDVHLMDAGHEYVDLGLSSGTLWSAYNLGEYDKDCHSFYAWGALYESDSYDWKHYNAYPKYDIPREVDLDHDVARKAWGGNWRIPTYHEFRELTEECVLTWCANPKGCLVKGPNGKRIFLPAYGYKKGFERNELKGLQGCYWSSSAFRGGCGNSFLFKEEDLQKEGLGIYSNSRMEICNGLSIRPVMSKIEHSSPEKEKKTVLILRPYRFNLNTPFDSVPWDPEGWKVEKPWFLAEPMKALDYFKDLCKKVCPDVIVSVGSASFFCKQLKDYPRICLNPNYLPSDDLEERKVLIKNPKTPQYLIDEYRKVEKTDLMARGDEKCVVVYGQPDYDEVYPTWDDPAFESWERIDVDPWASPHNWMNTFLYPLIEKMIK